MGTVTIFRLSLDTDTILTTSDKIIFNTTENTKIESAHCTEIVNSPTDGIGNNQGAEQDLGDQQALGLLEDTVKVTGFISKRDGNLSNGQNQFLIILDLWANEAKINDNWQLGRFALQDNDDHTNDLIPIRTGTSQIALLWEKYEKKTNMKGNRVDFTLWFRINRGDGT